MTIDYKNVQSACIRGDLEALEAFKAQGADFNITTKKTGSTFLHYATYNRQEEVALWLIGEGVDVNAQTKNRETALHYACFRPQPRVVRKLIKAGAELDTRQIFGNTPLHYAAMKSRSLALYLLSRGADASIRNDKNMLARDYVDGSRFQRFLIWNSMTLVNNIRRIRNK